MATMVPQRFDQLAVGGTYEVLYRKETFRAILMGIFDDPQDGKRYASFENGRKFSSDDAEVRYFRWLA